jgi:hypothetical protein
MEKQFKIIRIVILTIGLTFLCIGAGIGYNVYASPEPGEDQTSYILPAVFMLIGFMDIMIVSVWSMIVNKKAKKEKWLLENGQSIRTKFVSVQMNQSLSVNNIHPFIVISQWQDPLTSVIHQFKSKNIWFNPHTHIDAEKTITVLYDPADMKSYVMDLSFLPAAL